MTVSIMRGDLIRGVRSLGDDLIVEILSKLPIKTVLRFRTVSKNWYNLTKTGYFITKHLHHEHHDLCMILSRAGNDNEFGLILGRAIEEKTVLTSMKLPVFSFVKEISYIELISSSSHGLICLVVHLNSNEEKVHRQIMIVWNPATEIYRILPKLNTPFFEDDSKIWNKTVVGFDFVHGDDTVISSNEYRIARIFELDEVGRGHVFRAQVLDRSKNSWRTVKNELLIPSCKMSRHIQESSITLNGVLYWNVQWSKISAGHFEHWVISFDLLGEIFRMIELPVDVRCYKKLDTPMLFLWKNTLALFQVSERMVWVMNNNNYDSPVWTFLFRIEDEFFQENAWPQCYGFWNDGFIFQHMVTHNEYELFSYDPNSETKYIIKRERGCFFRRGVLNYIQTAAPV